MTYVVEACGEANIPVIVLDRPNPLGKIMTGGLELGFYLLKAKQTVKLPVF